MAVPDGWPSARVRAGAQNPAYRPARPPPALLTCISAGDISVGGTHARSCECLVQRVPGAATSLRNQVPVQVYGRGDGLVAEPAGQLRDRHALGQGGAGERMPEVMEGGRRSTMTTC